MMYIWNEESTRQGHDLTWSQFSKDEAVSQSTFI